jgi:hypothetical protein
MATDVGICNLALSHLGDRATVVSIEPPEGSAQADHCAQFYPLARDALLEVHDWKFARRRAVLAQAVNPSSTWLYAYAVPSGMLRARAVLASDASDDLVASGQYTPQRFEIETLADGSEVILTNQDQAVLRYTVRINDATKFPPLFTQSLGWMLASMLAGPVLKGEEGRTAARACEQQAVFWLSRATASDAGQAHAMPRQDQHAVSWVVNR